MVHATFFFPPIAGPLLAALVLRRLALPFQLLSAARKDAWRMQSMRSTPLVAEVVHVRRQAAPQGRHPYLLSVRWTAILLLVGSVRVVHFYIL